MVGAEVTSTLLDVQPGLTKVLASTVGADTTRYIHGPMGMQSQQSPQGAWVFPVTDGLGSVRGVVSDVLSPLESRQYEPYGEPFARPARTRPRLASPASGPTTMTCSTYGRATSIRPWEGSSTLIQQN